MTLGEQLRSIATAAIQKRYLEGIAMMDGMDVSKHLDIIKGNLADVAAQGGYEFVYDTTDLTTDQCLAIRHQLRKEEIEVVLNADINEEGTRPIKKILFTFEHAGNFF